MNIDYQLLSPEQRRSEPLAKDTDLGFGQLRTDHIFLMDYQNGAWINERIVPYQNLQLAPGAMALHYGQSIFEGAKAFLHQDNEIYTFRLNKNCERLNQSAEILSMPSLDVDMQLQAINALLDVERLWMPTATGASMYIRPFMFATDDSLSVKPSNSYTFAVMLSPSGAYYAKGMSNSLKLLITQQYHRAVSGGTGAAKAAGNYAASLRAQQHASSVGADQVLYLDASNQYLEEVGAMNHFHITRSGELVIPEFTDTILKSITSQSILSLTNELKSLLGLTPVQKKISIKQFLADVQSGEIIEAGGFGTAAVTASVGHYILDNGEHYTVGNGEIGEKTQKLYQYYSDLQQGKQPAPDSWLVSVERNN
ncbi:branched-chain amino acid aminotransferase [Pseudoalteromonas sp. SSM20]|uniref:branched-chain amino acid aminotransferase n=1 Tax=Pseudoalteromonas sp. SSM20 TaxID=3139394 RepID=UPI003BAD4ED6